jgi:hypothetical protein
MLERRPRRAVLVGIIGALACAIGGQVPGSAVAATTAPVGCSTVGLPSSQHTIRVPGVIHATVFLCDVAKAPPPPTCRVYSVFVPGALSVKVFLICPPSPPPPPRG